MSAAYEEWDRECLVRGIDRRDHEARYRVLEEVLLPEALENERRMSEIAEADRLRAIDDLESWSRRHHVSESAVRELLRIPRLERLLTPRRSRE